MNENIKLENDQSWIAFRNFIETNIKQDSPKMTRPEFRRAFARFKKMKSYEDSNFFDQSSYVGIRVKPSKYMPHIGKKQRGITE